MIPNDSSRFPDANGRLRLRAVVLPAVPHAQHHLGNGGEHEEGQDGRGNEAANDGRGERLLDLGARAMGKRHGHEADGRNEAGHDHGAHLLGHAFANGVDKRASGFEMSSDRRHDDKSVEHRDAGEADEPNRRRHREGAGVRTAQSDVFARGVGVALDDRPAGHPGLDRMYQYGLEVQDALDDRPGQPDAGFGVEQAIWDVGERVEEALLVRDALGRAVEQPAVLADPVYVGGVPGRAAHLSVAEGSSLLGFGRMQAEQEAVVADKFVERALERDGRAAVDLGDGTVGQLLHDLLGCQQVIPHRGAPRSGTRGAAPTARMR